MEPKYRIIRFEWEQGTRYGLLEGDEVISIKGSIYENFERGPKLCNLSDVKLLPPVRPNYVVGVGGNYWSVVKQVGKEPTNQPMLWGRPGSSAVGHMESVVYPATSRRVNYGIELTAVMKRDTWNVPEDKALDYVLGYTCGHDMTAWDLMAEDEGSQTRAKGFPWGQPLGPCVSIGLDISKLRLQSKINGELVQHGVTDDLIFSIPKLISYISKYILLGPGDCILTGQPQTNIVQVGDVIESEIEGIGVLRNEIVAG